MVLYGFRFSSPGIDTLSAGDRVSQL
jgi:hypothetical protein